MAKAILFVNKKKENAPLLAAEIKPELEKRGLEVDSFVFDEEPVFCPPEGAVYDIAFSLGGDGTVLYTARSMAPLGVPVFPVNLGTVGFIAGIHPENWKAVFDEWYGLRRGVLDGAKAARSAAQAKAQKTDTEDAEPHTPLLGSDGVRVSRRLMLETTVERRGAVVSRNICLNEVVISSPGIVKLLRLDFSLGESYHGGEKKFLHLGQYRSDGLIAATPTGSTAYSAAAGGAILDPELEAFILNPICPFTLSHRPLVFPAEETLLIEVEKEQKNGALLSMDGQVNEPLEGGDKIYVSRAPYKTVLIGSGRTVFYEALKTKFSWLSMPKTAAGTRLNPGVSGEGKTHA